MKSFKTLEQALFEELVKKESKLSEELMKLREDPLFSSYVYELYGMAIDKDGNVKYSKLMQKIDRKTAQSLKNMQEELLQQLDGDEFAEVRGEYPLSVMEFDQLNRIDAMKALYGMTDLKIAMKEAAILKEHFEAWADTVFAMVETYFGLKRLSKVALVHSFEPSMYHQRLTAGLEAGKRLSMDVLRAMPVEKAVEDVTRYVAKKDKQITDRIMFTEGTTVTESTAVEAMRHHIKTFHTVCVKDGKTCADCKAIEREQEANPCPVENYEPGITAPPFHVYCRCWIEFDDGGKTS